MEEVSLFVKYPLVTLWIGSFSFFITEGWMMGGKTSSFKGKDLIKNIALESILFTLSVILCVLMPNKVNMHTFQFHSIISFLLSGTIGSIFVFYIAFLIPDGIGILGEIGRNSLDIMAFHYPPFPIIFYINRICDLFKVPYFFRSIIVIVNILVWMWVWSHIKKYIRSYCNV